MSDSAATTPGPCVFPRCVKGEQPSYCGHDCDVREKPYEHEYGTPADGLAADVQELRAELLGVIDDVATEARIYGVPFGSEAQRAAARLLNAYEAELAAEDAELRCSDTK